MDETICAPLDRNAPWDTGVGLKHAHARDIFAGTTGVDFFEVHAENYMGEVAM